MSPVCVQEQLDVGLGESATFSIPQSKSGSSHANVLPELATTTSALHIRGKIKTLAALVELEVRSSRLQHLNNGFKKNICKDKSFLVYQ